ncbi:ATP-binding protein [uncultured Cohaesibacter sp.]|uniref:ATP-binding protein n=1 Tax=uncultured Cohaesibacter sp. TaxID=1002546 RepID=UPI00292FD2AF|nr:ATP-binding protein [uncultured Cohaesibacter sp.]
MKSITRYLIVNVLIWALITAFGSGIILTEFFRISSQSSFDDQLEMVLKIIVGEVATQLIGDDDLVAPANLGEPRFELPLSGWYWTISKVESDEIILSSLSLGGESFSINPERSKDNGEGAGRFVNGQGPDGEAIRILERKISFGSDKDYFFRVTGNTEEFEAQVASFQGKAWMIMAMFSVILLVVSFLLVRSALRPLTLLQQRVRDVATGRSEKIEGSYPKEVAGLVNEANLLIASNKDTLERARTQLGNLAHALKTPLSVITNEVRGEETGKTPLLAQQAQIMRDQIQLYLERARMAARHNIIGSVTKVQPVLSKLIDVMRKIYPDRTIDFHFDDAADVSFRGEYRDLEEMAGNLIDNACKWAEGHVVVTMLAHRPSFSPKAGSASKLPVQAWLTMIVEDDGAGMSEAEMELAIKRGQRIDESKPGTGLGLSIVKEMAELYHGEFELGLSELGGLRATVILPAIET